MAAPAWGPELQHCLHTGGEEGERVKTELHNIHMYLLVFILLIKRMNIYAKHVRKIFAG